jgi:hypothetical protein
MQLGGYADFYALVFGVMYLAWSDFAMGPTASVHQILYRCGKNCDRDPGND